MIRELTAADKEDILAFAYKREQENMFVIGGFNRTSDPFSENVFLGYFENDRLAGLATYFGRYCSLAINAQKDSIVHEFVDRIIERALLIEVVPSFKRYAVPTIERLRFHGMKPKKEKDETVFILQPEDFIQLPTTDVVMGTLGDIDSIIRLDRLANDTDVNKEIRGKDRKRIFPEDMFLLKKNGQIISQASIHGYSEHFAQIGCVGTHPDFRGQGFAKQTVGAVCSYWISRGKSMILFCRNDNLPALKVYASLGFKPIDEFMIAEY